MSKATFRLRPLWGRIPAEAICESIIQGGVSHDFGAGSPQEVRFYVPFWANRYGDEKIYGSFAGDPFTRGII